MKTIIEGHRYELENVGGTKAEVQSIQFFQQEAVEGYDQLRTVSDGTTNEEVIAMLIDRMQFLQRSLPCKENAIVITNLEESLMWLNKRTEGRQARGVEGKKLA